MTRRPTYLRRAPLHCAYWQPRYRGYERKPVWRIPMLPVLIGVAAWCVIAWLAAQWLLDGVASGAIR